VCLWWAGVLFNGVCCCMCWMVLTDALQWVFSFKCSPCSSPSKRAPGSGRVLYTLVLLQSQLSQCHFLSCQGFMEFSLEKAKRDGPLLMQGSVVSDRPLQDFQAWDHLKLELNSPQAYLEEHHLLTSSQRKVFCINYLNQGLLPSLVNWTNKWRRKS
jgi:hypothetical protein